MSIKLLLANVIVAFFLPGLILVPSWADQIEQKIVVYNRLNYIPEGVLEDFTKETGINVEYSTYSNDELLFTKTRLLKGRGYDVLISSTDLVDRMRREGLIQPIDHHKLPSYKQLDPSLLNKPYDPQNEFSIPYLWGSTGITIDTSMVDVNKITSWQDLWHRQWRDKLLLINDMREVFHIALKVNGYSINTTDPEEIKRAYE
ncbi:MAG: extracellular solute-binding protein, partial [Thiotrichaceae bacterium]